MTIGESWNVDWEVDRDIVSVDGIVTTPPILLLRPTARRCPLGVIHCMQIFV